MTPERRQQLRSAKVIISETLMVIAVIILVVILAFLVSGYWISPEGQVDRQGLLQLSSVPTGATVTIDGFETSWLERTNMSRNLSSGEHTISLTRDGYDSWSKTIDVSEGLLYRIHYPRLFLTEREKEVVLDTKNFSSATISPDHNYLILLNDTTEWESVNLNSESIKPKKVSVRNLFMATANATSAASATEKTVFNGTIEQINWDHDSSHALIKAKFGDTIEWLLFDVKNPENSVNITRQYGANFSDIRILDNSSNNLLVIQNHNLHKIDLGAKAFSSVLVENVIDFDHYNQNEVVFSAQKATPEGDPDYYLGIFRIGDKEVKTLSETTQPARVVLGKFYEDKFIAVLEASHLSIHRRDDFAELKNFDLTFSPDSLVVGHNGEFLIMRSQGHIATLDMESMSVSEWHADSDSPDWIDNDMFYSVHEGELFVYDYDGLNRRSIAHNVSAHFPAAITDDKWLYYFSDGSLLREWLIPR